jgi:ATP phosphoribosyltransferase
MLRVAVPNKGPRIAEPAAQMLREAGYRQRTDSRELVLIDPDNGIEFYYLRPNDIPVFSLTCTSASASRRTSIASAASR